MYWLQSKSVVFESGPSCEDRRNGKVLSHNLMLDHAVSLRTAAAAVVVIVDASGEA